MANGYWTQTELARVVGVHRNTIRRWSREGTPDGCPVEKLTVSREGVRIGRDKVDQLRDWQRERSPLDVHAPFLDTANTNEGLFELVRAVRNARQKTKKEIARLKKWERELYELERRIYRAMD